MSLTGADWGMGDFNDDGAVNGIDATMFATNYGYGVVAAVPEPSILIALAGLFLTTFILQRTRKVKP